MTERERPDAQRTPSEDPVITGRVELYKDAINFLNGERTLKPRNLFERWKNGQKIKIFEAAVQSAVGEQNLQK
jgi:hypothetical protein